MLRPSDIDRVLDAARRRAGSLGLNAPGGPHSRGVVPNAGRAASPRGPGATRRKETLSTASLGTGIKPWWAYRDVALPGGGQGVVNVGTGNLLLQVGDMLVPHKGVPMVFRRTYNSQSQHDVLGTDGAQPSMFGNGWTNTFDAHLSGDTNSGTVTVFDADGARYDYTGSDAAGWSPPPGQHATLVSDGACSYLWTKKDGTTFYFFGTVETSRCVGQYALYGGFAGRLHQIIGRNRNTYLSFNYTWDNGNAAPGGKISAISVVAESGLTTTLSFVDISGYRLLQTLTYPDGTAVYYGYDTSGNLIYVNRPPNNAAGARPGQGYGYQALGSGTVMFWAASPRWMGNTPGTDGTYTVFTFSGSTHSSATVNMVGRAGWVNPTINDGSSSQVLQPQYGGGSLTYDQENYTTGVATPTMSDADNHAVNWVMDAQQRPTQTQVATSSVTSGGTTTTNYLVSNLTWDAQNNLVAVVAPSGGETDATYDSAGNIVALALPITAVMNSSFGWDAYRPTRLFDYDTFSNVVAYCDAAETHPAGDWTVSYSGQSPGQYTGGSDSYCTSLLGNANHMRFSYSYGSSEPYGELTTMVSPSGYTRTIAYDSGAQGGLDFGLPTRIFGTAVTQFDNTGRTPSESMAYDSNGNLVCKKSDSASGGAALMTYDTLNRLVTAADPDDASTTSTSCSKTPGLAGSTTVSSWSYFPDGSVASTQSPSQAALTSGTAYVYDLDSNVVQQAPYSPTPQSTSTPTLKRWFDGADRLVETSQPADPNTSGDLPLLIRYVYDLSQGRSGTTLSGASVPAHGNLYEIQKNKPGGWSDFSYAAFDLADRVTTTYDFAPCAATGSAGAVYCTQTPFATQYTWDVAGYGPYPPYGLPGQLAQVTNALGQTKSWVYDYDERVTSVAYNDTVTPNVNYGYDADGRINFSYWTLFGGANNTTEYQYSPDGLLSQVRDDYSNSTTSYNYYVDGMLSSVGATTTSLVSQPALYQYSYRNDGLLQRETFGVTNQSVSFGYTAGGRPTTMTDFGSSASITRTYDAHGQLASVATPAGAYGSITHNALGQVLQYTAFNGETVTSQYNIRGDLVGRTFQPNPVDPNTGNPTYPGFQYRNVQGVLVQSTTDQYDGLTGAPLVIGGYQVTYDAIGRMSHSGSANAYTYDSESRLLSGDTTAVSNAGDGNCATGGTRTPSTSTETSYTYNGRGELSQDVFTSAGHSYSRQWYWDGGTPLYTASGLGSGAKALDGFQADSLGAIPANGGAPGLTVADLDLDGTVAARHNNTGHSAWYASNVFHQECVSSNPVPASAGYVDPFATSTTPVDDGASDPSLIVTSTGRAFLSTAMGYTTPDYSSSTPYSSSRRGTRDYCVKNPITGHYDLVRADDGHPLDACAQDPKNGFEGFGGGDPFGFGVKHPPGGGTQKLPAPKRVPPKPKPACIKGDYLAFSISKGSLDIEPGPGISVGATLSKEGTITPSLWLGVGVGAGPTLVTGNVQKPVGGSVDDFPAVTLSSGAFAGSGQSLNWAGPDQYAYESGVGFPQVFAGLQFSATPLSRNSKSVADLFCH
jgi:YD repeat-containing protein